jgi:hypothetical protein
MKKPTKKEIRNSIISAIETAIARLKVTLTSKKTKKIVNKTAKLLAFEINKNLKKQIANVQLARTAVAKKKTASSAKTVARNKPKSGKIK